MKKLFWLCQGSEYVWSFYMFDRLLMMLWVLNLPGFWIWDGFIWKGCTKFWICLNMAQYASIMSEYALMFLIMPENGWMLLDVTKYAWKCLNKLFWLCQGSQYTLSSQIFDIYASGIKYARVLNIWWYSYNNIVSIGTNVILEFLPGWFLHPGALQLTILFLKTS